MGILFLTFIRELEVQECHVVRSHSKFFQFSWFEYNTDTIPSFGTASIPKIKNFMEIIKKTNQKKGYPICLSFPQNKIVYVVLFSMLQWYETFGFKWSLKNIYETFSSQGEKIKNKKKRHSTCGKSFYVYKASFA